MSDSENVDVKKRGRTSAAEKRSHVSSNSKKDEKAADGETPAKRGRGRPKGTTKKNGNKAQSKKSNSGKGRGRPSKKKDDSTEDETEENEEDEDNEEEDNESNSDE